MKSFGFGNLFRRFVLAVFSAFLLAFPLSSFSSTEPEIPSTTFTESMFIEVPNNVNVLLWGYGGWLGDCSFEALNEGDREYLLEWIAIKKENDPQYREAKERVLKKRFSPSFQPGPDDLEAHSFYTIYKKIASKCKAKVVIAMVREPLSGLFKASGKFIFRLFENEVALHGYSRFPIKEIRENGSQYHYIVSSLSWELYEKAVAKENQIWDWLDEKGQETLAAYQKAAAKLSDTKEKSLVWISETYNAASASISESTEQSLLWAKSKYETSAEFFRNASDQSSVWIKDHYNASAAYLADLSASTSLWMSEKYSAASATVSENSEKAAEWAKATYASTAETFQEASDKSKEWVGEKYAGASESLSEASAKGKAWTSEKLAEASEGIHSASEKSLNFLKDKYQAAKDKFQKDPEAQTAEASPAQEAPAQAKKDSEPEEMAI